jgi:hypothetical protein
MTVLSALLVSTLSLLLLSFTSDLVVQQQKMTYNNAQGLFKGEQKTKAW